jgi:2',3'-cyclic-nucleotide 2'-phosphodiesterase (5'-nucleotidase family)
MRQTAGNMGVDLLLVDTGDLHDGTGLSDATKVDGSNSMPIFNEIEYDLLTIGEWCFICHHNCGRLIPG